MTRNKSAKEGRDTLDLDAVLNEYMNINNELANIQRELLRKQRVIEKQAQGFRDVVTSTPDAQIVLSAKGRVLFLNPAARRLFAETVEDAPFPMQGWEGEEEVELQIDGKVLVMELSRVDIVWDGNDAILLSLHDISLRKQAEEQRLKAHKLEGVLEMAGAAAHEFSQPLQALQMEADFIAQVISVDDEDVGEALRSIMENIQRLAVIVRKTQSVTHYVSTKYTGNTNIVDLNKSSSI